MKKLGLLFVVVISLVFTISCVSKEVPVTETYYETEYKTEYRTETYTATEDVVVRTSEGKTSLTPISKWYAGIYFKAAGSGAGTYYYGYKMDTNEHTRSEVKISVSPMAQGHIGVYDLTGVGQIPIVPTTLASWREVDPKTGGLWMTPGEQAWLDNLNAILTNPELILGYSTGQVGELSFDAKGIREFAILANTWNAHAVISVRLAWSDDIIEKKTVTKERQVPYQVPVQVEKQRTVMQTKKVPFWEVWKAEPAAESPSLAPVPPAEESSPPPSPPITPEVEPPVTSPRLLYEDDFSNSYSGWGTGSDDWGKFVYEGGEYSISIERTNWFDYHLNSVSGMQEDFTVEVDARKLAQGTDAAGIIFRDQMGQGKWSFYVFWVDSNSGTYAIQKYIKDVWAPDLKDFTRSNYINRGANTNRLKVTCKGNQIEVYANDYKLTTVTDTSLTSGYIGLAAETFASSNAHYHFDNFKLYTND